MSLEQCNRCLYHDRLFLVDVPYCPVREGDMPRADDCSDFEEDDGTCAEGAEE